MKERDSLIDDLIVMFLIAVITCVQVFVSSDAAQTLAMIMIWVTVRDINSRKGKHEG